MFWRPYANVAVGLGLFDCIRHGIDIFGKCFWNWDCWLNLDCNLRILTPAVAECTFDVLFPALIITFLVMSGIYAAVWACTRPYAALVCVGTTVTGLVAAITLGESATKVSGLGLKVTRFASARQLMARLLVDVRRLMHVYARACRRGRAGGG
jgi:hypothetical protein